MEKLLRQLGNRSLKELAQATCFFVLFFSLSSSSFAEGTKELAPTAADFNKADMHIFDVSGGITRDFMTYIAKPTSRLNIEICNPGEIIYFGFNYNTADITGCNKLYYRIKSPSGIIIFGPQQVTNAGAGSIGSYTQATIGPNALVGGAGGYTALSVDPISALIALGQAPELGSYYIEFNPNDPNTFLNSSASCTGSIRPVRLPAFDITVADAPNGNAIKGRLWSQAWDLITNSFTNPFNGTMYVYADDGIVTNINFNGIQPNGFIVSCNRTGVANSGNAFTDRKSLANTNSTYGSYKIFLNDPDANCFPTGIFGALTGPINVTGCDQNNRCINVPVDKQGDAQLILNLNGVPGYQPGTADRLLSTVLTVGNNCILWDSRDGLGNIVSPGTNIPIQLDYFNGLTNLPLYDVENHKNGFIVNLVRPAGPQPKLFWDDSNIPGGTINLTGCTAGAPPAGCHQWNGTTFAPDGTTGKITSAYGWGDLHTVNTWWYANIITATASYNVATIVVDADASNAANAPNKKTVCTTTPTLVLNGSVTGSSTTGVWSRVGGGGNFANATVLNTTYTFSAADYLAGTVKLLLTSSNNGACPPAIDTLTISVIAGPTVNAGGPVTVCANNAVIANLGGSFGGAATGATWTGGTTAGFTPNRNKPTAQYTPTAGEIAGTTLVLTLTTTGSGICPEVSDTKTITFSTPPLVTMGSDVTVCANNPVASITATATNATSVLWTGGAAGSSFGNAALATTTYNPAPSEKSAAPTSVTLTFKASKAGCIDASGTLKVNITPTPVMNAGPNRSICANDSINLVGTRTNAPSSTWSSPTATATSFKPNATSLSTNYKPTAADIANGSVVISLTSSGNNCTPVVSTMTLTITPAPTINAGADKTVCANNPVTTISATTTAPGVQWSAGGGSYSASATSNPLTYTLSAAEVSAASTGLLVRTTGGTCPPVIDTVLIFVTPSPTVNAGPDLPSCANNATVQVTSATTSAAGVTWSTLNGGAFSNTAVINPFFTPSATDVAAGKATIIITANQAGCLPVRDTALVIIDPTPIVSAGPNRSVCSNNATVILSGTVTNATGLIWSTAGDGKFSPGATPTATGLAPTYVPGPTDISSGGPIIITARSTGGGVRCTQVASTMQLTIYAAPTVNAGTAGPVCANNAASITLSGTATNATTTTWTGGAGGTFGAANNLNTTYSTLPAERVPGGITFTLTATKAGCNNVTGTVTATITPAPTINAGSAPSVCATTPIANLSASETVASGGTWTGAGTFSAVNSLNTTYTPTATEIVNGTASVTITSTGNGNCLPVNASVTITITPPPTVDAGNNQTVCGLNPTVNLTATATNQGSATWTILTGSGNFSNASNLTTNYNAVAADVTRGFVDLRVTVLGLSPCSSIFDDIHISFTPVPSANAGPNQTVCTTEFPVQLAGSGSTGTWSSVTSAPGTFNPNSGTLNATYTPSASEIAAHTATLRYSTTASAFCPSVFSDVVITIVDGPVVSAGSPATICGNVTTINLTGTVTGPSTTGGFWSTANGTGTIANPNNLSTTYTISAADITRGTVTFDLASVGSAQCNVVHSTVTYTILAPISVSAGPNQNVCGLGGISLNGTSSTGTATWSIVAGTGSFNNANLLNAVFTPTVAVPGAVTLRLTTTGNGICPAQQADVTFNISAAPTVSAGPNQTICADSAYVQLAGTFTVASGIRWSKVVGTGTFSPDSVSTNSRYTPSAADRTSGTVTLRATTTGNGICSAVFADMTITITPKVTISAGADQTLCANNAVATIGGTVSGGSTTGAWTSSSGNAAGFANPAALSTTYTPSATDISNAIVTLTFISTANGNCKATSDQMIIHYTPASVVNAGFPLTACASSITTGGVALNGSVTGGSTTGIWSSPSAGSSFTPNNTTLNAHYIPTAADTTAKTVTLTLTSTGNGNCTAVSQTVMITFAPIPFVDAGPDVTICADSFYVALNGKIANAGGGIWSTTAGAGTFLPSTVTLNANFTPSAAARTAHVAVLTLTSTSNGSCAAVADNKIITITDAPTVNAGPDITVCANDSVAHIVGASFTVAGGVQWTSNGSPSFSNATSTTTNYSPNALDISSSPLTLTIRTTGNGMCKPATDQMILTITPAPIVSAGPNQTVCADIPGVQLNGTVSAGSTTGTWSTPTTGGTFSPNANTLNAVYNLAPADITAGTVTLTLTSTGNGLCKAVAKTMTIQITPAPTVNAGSDLTICADGTAALNGSFTVASGIQWSTAGSGAFSPSAFVTNPVYTPSNADTTAHSVVLTLTTTGNGTCIPVSKNITLTINPTPIVEAGLNRVVCADVDQINLSASVLHATGGTWTTNGNGSFSPSASTVNATYIPSANDIASGNITLTLAATGAGTCGPVSDNMTISFTPIPTVSAGPDINVCTGTASINVNGSATNASNFQWTVISGTTGGSITGASATTLVAQYLSNPLDVDVTLRLTAIPGGGCSNVDDDMHITFSAAPPINAGPNQTVCTSELPIKLNATGTTAQWNPAGGVFSPNDQTLNATYMPSAGEIAAGTVTLTINTTNNGVCPPGTSSVTITINPGPTVSAGADQTICKNVSSVTLAGTKNAVASGINWTRVSSSGTFNNSTLLGATYTPSAADYSAGVATLVITTTGHPGCNPVSDTMQIFVTPEPTLNLGPNITVCGDAVSVPLSATTTNAATIAWTNVTGTGSFSSTNTNNTTYNINPADPVPGTLTLQAEVTPAVSSGTCNNVIKTVSINRTPIPTVNAGPGPVSRCTTTPNVVLNGSVITVATGGIWTSNGTGSFSPSNTTLHPTYVPSAADLLLPSVVLTLTTTGNGQCQTYSSPITINFDQQPTITAAPSQPLICSGSTVSFTSSFTNATGVFWTKNGADGTFDNNTITTPVFTPGPNDIANGGMIITVTTTGATTCNQAVKNMAIGIIPSPVASVNAGFDQIVCADVDTVQLNGFIAIALGGQWSVSTNKGLFLPNSNDLSAKYIPDATDKVAGNTIVVTLTSTGNGICAPTSDDMNLSFTPIPTVAAGADMIVCADTAYLQLSPTITTALGGVWTTNGTGTFAPNSASNPSKYVLSKNDIALGSLGFTVATTGNGTCKTYESSLAVTITAKPTLNLGPDRIVCAAASTVNFNSANTVATATLWSSSGAGSFTPNPNISTAYSVMPADTAAKTINIFAQSANQGNCKAVYDTLLLTFQPKPITVAGPPISSCANVPSVNLLSAAVYNATGGRWTSSGNGSFSSPTNQLNNVYNPSPTDRTNGTVTLTFTSTGNGQCGASFSQTTITIAPSPIVTANPAILCDPALGAPLSGTVTNASGGAWSSSVTGGSFAPSPTLLSATYFPSPAETAAGKAILTLTSTGNGSCNPETASINIVIEPLPIANAGPDQFTCDNGGGSVDLAANPIQTNVTYTWAISGGAVIATTPRTTASLTTNTAYVLTARDAKGCNVTDTMQANVFTIPASFNITPSPLCFEENMVIQSNPSVVPVQGGTFQWFRDGVLLAGENKTFINPDVAGVYKIVYFYSAGCTNSASATLNSLPQITTEDVVDCNTNTTLAATLINPANYPSGVSYNWTPGAGSTASTYNVPVVASDTSLYYVNVTDNLTNCVAKDSVYLIGLPVPTFRPIDSIACAGSTVKVSARPLNIPDLDQFRNTLSFTWTKNGNADPNTDSLYFVTQDSLYVGTVTIDRCIASVTHKVKFAPYPVSTLPDRLKFCDEKSVTLVLDAGPAFKHQWLTGNPADTLQTLTITPTQTQKYFVTLTNQFGCGITDSVLVRDICEPRLFNPNAFTPGCTSCANNNVFQVYGAHIGKYSISIFNRWGEVIFYSEDMNHSWDGVYLGELMPVGVYPFIIYYEGVDEYADVHNMVKGKVTLIR